MQRFNKVLRRAKSETDTEEKKAKDMAQLISRSFSEEEKENDYISIASSPKQSPKEKISLIFDDNIDGHTISRIQKAHDKIIIAAKERHFVFRTEKFLYNHTQISDRINSFTNIIDKKDNESNKYIASNHTDTQDKKNFLSLLKNLFQTLICVKNYEYFKNSEKYQKIPQIVDTLFTELLSLPNIKEKLKLLTDDERKEYSAIPEIKQDNIVTQVINTSQNSSDRNGKSFQKNPESTNSPNNFLRFMRPKSEEQTSPHNSSKSSPQTPGNHAYSRKKKS